MGQLSVVRSVRSARRQLLGKLHQDHLPFNWVGLPGFQFIQDGLDYFSRTHHSNLDVFDYARGEDLKQASVVLASFVYHAAMRENRLPRKPMPREPPRSEKPAEEPAPEDETPTEEIESDHHPR